MNGAIADTASVGVAVLNCFCMCDGLWNSKKLTRQNRFARRHSQVLVIRLGLRTIGARHTNAAVIGGIAGANGVRYRGRWATLPRSAH
jgi:sulfite exporter TauE/SafE